MTGGCDATTLCAGGSYCVEPSDGGPGQCQASCPPGQGYNSNRICFGPCGSTPGFTCLSGFCSDLSAGSCADNSTCLTNTLGVDATGVCGGVCSPTLNCAEDYCDENAGTCVSGCPSTEGITMVDGGLHCVSCPSGQGVSGYDHTCGGPCDFGQATSCCATGYCENVPFAGGRCASACASGEAPNTNGDCGGSCTTGPDCPGGYCSGGVCVSACPAGAPADYQNTCGGYCDAAHPCQSGYCDAVSSGSVDHSTGTCVDSCGSTYSPNSNRTCGGQCAGNGTCLSGACNEPVNGYNFCVASCPNGAGVDAYGYCGGQCGDGQGSNPPVCASGCCSDAANGSCFVQADATCGDTGAICFDCASSGQSCVRRTGHYTCL